MIIMTHEFLQGTGRQTALQPPDFCRCGNTVVETSEGHQRLQTLWISLMETNSESLPKYISECLREEKKGAVSRDAS